MRPYQGAVATINSFPWRRSAKGAFPATRVTSVGEVRPRLGGEANGSTESTLPFNEITAKALAGTKPTFAPSCDFG